MRTIFLSRPTQSATTAMSARAGYLLPLLPFSALVLHIGGGGYGDFTGVFAFPSIVGYQNKGFDNSGYNIAGNTFLTIGKAADEMTLGDLVPNDEFVNSSIQFMTAGGANAKTTFKGKSVTAKYVYWTAGDDPEEGPGWYLAVDDDGEVNQNALSLPMGTGFLVSRNASETDAQLVYSGEVNAAPVTKELPSSGYNVIGNCCPTDLKIGDITPNEDFVNSSIQFMTPGGANAKTTFKGKSVTAKYTYWTAGDDPEEGPGWYLAVDDDGEINQNDLVDIPAGAGFLVSRNASEPDATVTLPSAL